VKVTVRTVTFTVHTARVPAPHNRSHHNQCRTPYEAVHILVLLMMGIMMPETCWDRSTIINIRLVASCWFLSLHPTFMTHGHNSLKIQQPYLTFIASGGLLSFIWRKNSLLLGNTEVYQNLNHCLLRNLC